MRTRVVVLRMLERIFAALECWAQTMAWRCAVCPDCGRNRYTGAPCQDSLQAEAR